MSLITPDFGIIFWQTITLLFVLMVLGKFAWKPMLHIMREREESIEKDLDAAEKARAIVAHLHDQQRELLEEANIQRAKIIREAEIAKDILLKEASIEAKQIKERMLEQARSVIAEEQKAAFEQLKGKVAKLSIGIAEKLLAKELEPQNKQDELMQLLIKKHYPN